MAYKEIYVKESVIAHQNIKERDYWLNKLSGLLEKSFFPYDNKTKENQQKVTPVKFSFSPALCSRLIQLSSGSDARLHMILVTGLIILLNKYSGSQDIVVGTPIYKPDREGEFINRVLPLRNKLQQNMSFKEVLLMVRQTIIEANENRDYPVEMLPKQLNMITEFSQYDGFPLFDAAILLENIQIKEYLRSIHLNIVFSFLRIGERIEGIINYNSLKYEEKTIQRIYSHFTRLLEKVLLNVNLKSSDIDILSHEENKQLLFDFNNTTSEYPCSSTIHSLFEKQTLKTPDNTSIIFEDKHLTYRGLNKRANQLAGMLRKMNVTTDCIVAIIMDNSLEMLIGILGILKAGGAYLPINPDFPHSRIISMLKDSGACLLLSKEKLIKDFCYIYLQHFEMGTTKPFVTPCRAQVEDLDRLQIPDRSLIDYERYRPYIGQAMVKNSITIQMSRGCVYNCAFCFKVWPNKYIIRSAENIFNEINYYYKMGIRRFAFVDDLPNINIKVSSEVFRLIIKNGLKVHLHFPNGIRGDILTKEYIDLMVEAGTITMDLALETSSPRLQKLIKKNLNIKKLEENIKYITRNYPHVLLELQIIHGIPSETEEEAKASLDFIKNIKWVHFPYIHILNIYPNSNMARIAVEHGISKESIEKSANIAYHELPDTLPFSKNFTKQYQAEFLNEYFLSKERLLSVLPYQMKVLTQDELVQKYNSYLPMEIGSFSDLLELMGISPPELKGKFLPEGYGVVPGFNQQLRCHFPQNRPHEKALNILLLDLSQYFTHDTKIMYDVVEPPLGLMYLLTHLNKQFGSKINGKIAKSRIDFDSYDELRVLIHEFKPDLIGIRTLNFYRDFFHKTISLMKQWGVDIPIIAGGPYATSYYSSILQDKNIDLAVLGEGEITLEEIVAKMIENNGKLPDEKILRNIPGIAFIESKEKKGQQRANREILLIDEVKYALVGESCENPVVLNKSTDMAYIIYTSGSTGKPKGVIVQHNNLVNQVTGLINTFELESSFKYLLLASFTFDVSVMHIFTSFLSGARLYVIREDIKKDSEKLWRFIHEKRIDILNIVPAFMKAILKSIEKKKISFKYLFVGGDVFDKELYTRLKETFDVREIINIYGPTETTINAALYRCQDLEMKDVIPIGKPLVNYRMYILDQNLNLVPIGVKGELCISGAGVARGYLNRPELTAERFSAGAPPVSSSSLISYPLPFDPLYRTGDLARWLPDGNIEFLGRVDKQVKIRGFRIELEEIEKRLLSMKDIKDTVVMARDDMGGDRYLCAYFVNSEKPERAGNNSQLRDYLSQTLPDYMVPSYFVQVEKIPLTPAGKVDKKALPDPKSKLGGEYEAPRHPIEKKLAEIWAEVLGIEKERIGINANFFELGGHSLKATILISKMHQRLDIKVPLVELFKTPTVRGLSQYIKGMSKEIHISIEPSETKEFYPVSSAQKRLYILQQMNPDSTAYNMPEIIPLPAVSDLRKLEETFKRIINRHDSLGTSFHIVNNTPVQVVHDKVEFEIEYYNLSKNYTDFVDDEKDTKNKAGQTEVFGSDIFQKDEPEAIIKSFIRPFHLSRAPLLHVGLLKTAEDGHLLLVDMHHIISDGVSHEILVRDFLSLYQGEELLPLRVQYKDFSQWQKGEKEKEKIKQQERYWLKEFAGEIPVLELPTDYPRPVEQSFEGDSVIFQITAEETQGLKAMALKGSSTLFMVLAAIVNILLSKLSGQEDIVIGTPIACRRHADLEKIIGMFVNTLSLRNYPAADRTFKDFLGDVKERTLKAFENQEYPFEDLVDKLSVNRDIGRNPLFDVMFALPNMNTVSAGQDENTEIENSRVLQHDSPNKYENMFQTAKFDLTLTTVERGRGLFFSIQYCTKLFKKVTIERFVIYFKKIISIAVNEPGIRISDIEVISEEEKNRLLYEFNDTEADYPKDKTIHRLFEEQVERTPDNIALHGCMTAWMHEGPKLPITKYKLQTNNKIQNTNYKENGALRADFDAFDEIQLSYGLLYKESNRLAYTLLENGVQPDTIVGIMTERSVEMIIGILGILKAGGAYMPIDPDYPQERITYMLKDSGTKLLITTSNLAEDGEKVKSWEGEKILLEDIHNLPKSSTHPLPFLPSYLQNSSNIAYIIYTSGTTGWPKGTIIEHRNVVRLMMNDKFQFDFSHRDIWTMFHSFCFDFSVWEMYGSLLYGGKLMVIPKMTTRDMERYLDFLKKMCVTVLNQTPSAFYNLSDMELSSTGSELSIRYVIFGGEALKLSRLKEWKSKYLWTKLINMYGITETTVHVTFKELKNSDIESNISNIGEPIPTLSTYVMDKNLKLLPIGIPGELVVGGEGVGRGYLNRSELSTEKFIENPYKVGERLYKSGDLVKLLSMGDLQYLGRIDRQVKIRGFRIELGEIENCLLRVGGIKEAVVLVQEEEGGDKYICAYFVSDREYGISELRNHLANELPDYMIPLYFARLEKMPLTPNGKVDRKALPGPERTTGESYIAPRDDVETKLAEIWSEALEIEKEKIGIKTNFFELGGHSLKATILVSKIQKEFEVRVPLVEVFKRQTISGLSEYIRGSQEVKYVGINPVEEKEYYGLSPAQTRMYIVQQMYRQSTEYNMPSTLLLEGDMDKDKLSDAFKGLVKRQSSLRTSFITVAEKPVQKIQDELDFELDYYDISELRMDGNPGEKEKNNYQSSILQNFIRPFDLSKAPIMRTGLIKLKANEHILIVDTHHIITDGVSSEILDRDLILLYSGKELPSLKLRYKDFSEWQNSAGQKELLKNQGKYWIQKFKGEITAVNLPADYERNEDTINFEGNYIRFLIPPPLSQNLKDLNRQMEVTLFMFLLAVYNILIYRYSGQEDIVIGSPVTGRNHADLHHIVGMFVNMLALRNQPQGRKTFKEFLKEVRQNVLDAFANQDYQFDELVKSVQIQGKSRKNPLFNIVLAVQNIDSSESEKAFNEYSSNLTLKYYQSNTIISRFDLTIFAREDNGKIHFLCRYPTSLFKEQTIEKLGEHYIEIIDQVTKNPEIKLEEIILSSSLMPASHTMQQNDEDFDF